MSDLDGDEYGRLTVGADGFSDSENDLPGDAPRAGPPTSLEEDATTGGASKRKKMAKPRLPIPKLDEDKLFSPAGFPKLMQTAKSFKSKGKGREFDDLEMLMEHYAVWAHQLFPRLKFGDFIAAMESTTKKRSMRHFLDVELDKFFGYATEEPLTAAQPEQPPSNEDNSPVNKTDDLADIDDAEFDEILEMERGMNADTRDPQRPPSPGDLSSEEEWPPGFD